MGEKGNDPAALAAGLSQKATASGNTGGMVGKAMMGMAAPDAGAPGAGSGGGGGSGLASGLGALGGHDQAGDIEAAIKAAGEQLPPPAG